MVSKILTWLKSFINNKEKYVIVFIDSTPAGEDETTPSSSVKAANMESCIRSKIKGEIYRDSINGIVTVLLDPFMVSLEDVILLLNLEFDSPNIYIDKDFIIIVDINKDNKLITSTVDNHKELKFAYSFEYKNVLMERLMSKLMG